MSNWNPWHGCHKISEGCLNCYVYRTDTLHNKDSSVITKTNSFDLPIKRNRSKEYKISSRDTVYTCFTSDFLHEGADLWRIEAWNFIKERSDLKFLFITKRIERFMVNLPNDWGDGYDNVEVGCTCENQDRANFRLPIFISLPIKHKFIICEPILEKIDLTQYLNNNKIKQVIVGGESGEHARICDYQWVLNIRQQCQNHGISFWFKQTGAKFMKNNKLYLIARKYQHSQAIKANINIGAADLYNNKT